MTGLAPLHPMYLGDDYPREGCRVAIDVQEKSCAVRVFAPGHHAGPPHSDAITGESPSISSILPGSSRPFFLSHTRVYPNIPDAKLNG